MPDNQKDLKGKEQKIILLFCVCEGYYPTFKLVWLSTFDLKTLILHIIKLASLKVGLTILLKNELVEEKTLNKQRQFVQRKTKTRKDCKYVQLNFNECIYKQFSFCLILSLFVGFFTFKVLEPFGIAEFLNK